MKIFLATSDNKDSNFSVLISKLRDDARFETKLPTGPDEIPPGIDVHHEASRLDMLAVLRSDLLIYDADANPGAHFLIWGMVPPHMATIIVSRSVPVIDPYYSRKVMAVVKPEIFATFVDLAARLFEANKSDQVL